MTLLVAKIVWALGCVAYFVIRYPHSRRARKTPVALRRTPLKEKILMAGSYAGLFIIPLTYVLTGWPEFASYPVSGMLVAAGTAVLICGMYLLYRTHRDLGRAWSITLEIRESHALVTHGIYARLRHPMYTAFWLWALSQALLLPNWIAGPAGLIGFGILFFARIDEEEQMMHERFGDAYREYVKRTDRIVPGVY